MSICCVLLMQAAICQVELWNSWQRAVAHSWVLQAVTTLLERFEVFCFDSHWSWQSENIHNSDSVAAETDTVSTDLVHVLIQCSSLLKKQEFCRWSFMKTWLHLWDIRDEYREYDND